MCAAVSLSPHTFTPILELVGCRGNERACAVATKARRDRGYTMECVAGGLEVRGRRFLMHIIKLEMFGREHFNKFIMFRNL